MARIDHVTVRSSDLDASLKLFTQVFELLEFTGRRHDGAGFYEWNDFSLAQADGEHPATKNVHVGFAAASRDQVDNWWKSLTSAGYADDGAPGPRRGYSANYYRTFTHIRDDISIEAANHDDSRAAGAIDPLWIRVHD